MSTSAAYLPPAPDAQRDPFDWVPEMSRRARAFTLYAAIRELGADGIAAMIERCCDLARRLAQRLGQAEGVRILNQVVLNQVLVGVGDPDVTRDVVARLAADGTMWAGGTMFHGQPAVRVSVSNWSTRADDIDAAAEAILRCAAAARDARGPSAGRMASG
jgi:glutamate/tyrosine decarboxylase-like PLP-dependent enzyme